MNQANRTAYKEGLRDSIPIGLGYLAVSFSLGIIAASAGLNAFQGFVASWFCAASAGEYVGFTLIASHASYMELAIMTIIANARYLLMSTAMSQRLSGKTSLLHRLFMALHITDELFAIAIARKGNLNPYYSYAAATLSIICWSVGTSLGVIAGDVLPQRIVSALGVALYGMFIAIIVPPAKENRIIAWIIGICFVCSAACTYLPLVSTISSGTRTILLTIIIASMAAWLFPHKEEKEDGE